MELLSELYKESIEYGSDYEELIMQNKIIMNFLKRYNSYNEYDYEDQDEVDYLMFKKIKLIFDGHYFVKYQLTINYQIFTVNHQHYAVSKQI